MKELICIYDSKLADKGTYSFIKAIQKEIEDIEVLDVNNPNVNWSRFFYKFEVIETLAVRPLKSKYGNVEIDYLIECSIDNPENPLVVEAILKCIGDFKGKNFLIINQGEHLGIPLVKELMKLRANIMSVSRNFKPEFMKGFDYVVTATGDETFKFDTGIFGNAQIIDLSEDTDEANVIRRVPIIKAIKERLR